VSAAPRTNHAEPRSRPPCIWARLQPCSLPAGRATMGMKTRDLPNGTSTVFEGAALEAEPVAAKTRAAHTPPIDIIGGRRLNLYSDGTPSVFKGATDSPVFIGLWPLFTAQELIRITFIPLRQGSTRAQIHDLPFPGASFNGNAAPRKLTSESWVTAPESPAPGRVPPCPAPPQTGMASRCAAPDSRPPCSPRPTATSVHR